jgi:hypothetical protein
MHYENALAVSKTVVHSIALVKHRILKLQKRTARLILYQDPIAPSAPLFKQLGWVTIEQRIKYHKYLLVSKCLKSKIQP